MELTLFVVGTFLLSAFVGWMTIPRIVLISKKKKLFDALTERKSHKGDIPRLGGVAFFPAFVFSISFAIGLRYSYGLDISTLFEMCAFKELMFLFAGMTILFIVGLSDDLTEVSYKTKFLSQLVAAFMLIYAGVGIDNLGGLFGVGNVPVFVGTVLTVLVIVLLCNAYNLIDGIDGLCSGLSLLALTTFGLWFLWHQIYIYSMIAFALCGVVSVFFFFNVMGNRLKIFMGDTGSLILGYVIAFMGLKFYALNIETSLYEIEAAPVVFLGVVFIPAFDTLRVFFVRMAAGYSPFHPDRRHIHHKFLRIGLTHLQSTLILVIIQLCFIVLNLSLRNYDINVLFAIDIFLGVLLVVFLNKLGERKERKLNKLNKSIE